MRPGVDMNRLDDEIDISPKTTNVNLLVVLEVKSGNHQNHLDLSSEGQECLYKSLWQLIR